jgi:proteasome accessory factor B
MSRRKTERLLSLVVCLLSTRRYLTAEQIRQAVAGYPEQPEAFKRMFERDKEELRELGIPLETGSLSPLDGEDIGYRVQQQAYELPELRLEADEAAVLGLAARVWQHAELAGAAAGALLKLRAAGIDTDDRDADAGARQGIEPRVHTTEPAFGPLWEAVRDRRPVTFAYRAAGRSEPQIRELEPWGVVNRHGRWYVAGRDRGRDAVRVFRLGRIEGDVRFSGPSGTVTVPAGTDVREVVRTWDSVPPRENTALLRVRPGAGYGLRRYATSPPDADSSPARSAPSDSAPSVSVRSASVPSDSVRSIRPDSASSASVPSDSSSSDSARAGSAQAGWDTITVPYSDVGWFADHVASFGADVVVTDPPDLRDAVISRLKGVLA